MCTIARWKTMPMEESGNVLVLAALSMTAQMGFVALSADVGILFRITRNVRTAADAAAIRTVAPRGVCTSAQTVTETDSSFTRDANFSLGTMERLNTHSRILAARR